jgi:AcrR family transcriptional regulator
MASYISMDKKEKILSAALKLFVEFGFHNTPTSKIAKEAGIANGTLFYFYPTKDALVKALYIDIKNRLSEQVAVWIKEEKELQAIMKGYYTATLQWAVKNKLEFYFIEQFNSSPYLKQIAESEIQKHVKPLHDLLKQGIKSKLIRNIDVEIIYLLISTHTFSINRYLISKNFSKAKQESVINETFGLLWDMIS